MFGLVLLKSLNDTWSGHRFSMLCFCCHWFRCFSSRSCFVSWAHRALCWMTRRLCQQQSGESFFAETWEFPLPVLDGRCAFRSVALLKCFDQRFAHCTHAHTHTHNYMCKQTQLWINIIRCMMWRQYLHDSVVFFLPVFRSECSRCALRLTFTYYIEIHMWYTRYFSIRAALYGYEAVDDRVSSMPESHPVVIFQCMGKFLSFPGSFGLIWIS